MVERSSFGGNEGVFAGDLEGRAGGDDVVWETGAAFGGRPGGWIAVVGSWACGTVG